jgi:uncharacterized protein
MRSKAQFQRLLARHGCSDRVIEHSIAVADKAFELSSRFSVAVDQDLIFKGAMLHDIGRGVAHKLVHFIAGAEIAREEGFSEEVVKIIERHVGAGLTAGEAEALGLPPKDYIPKTPEEIVVSYADNTTKGTIHLSFKDALERFKVRLGQNHPAVERFKAQHAQIEGWTKKL